jgi:HPt (histidine-containing phosphotransfer) domain-containing protein
VSAATHVLDPWALRRLALDLGDRTFVTSFAGRYRRMLHGRVGRLADAVARHDLDAALDQALSLKTASLTVGAPGLAALALEVEQRLRASDLDAALDAVRRLPCAAAAVDEALGDYLAG